MKKSKFTETQIVKAIQEHEADRKAEDICLELGITAAFFYKTPNGIHPLRLRVSAVKNLPLRR